jgi:hypothetical protein
VWEQHELWNWKAAASITKEERERTARENYKIIASTALTKHFNEIL